MNISSTSSQAAGLIPGTVPDTGAVSESVPSAPAAGDSAQPGRLPSGGASSSAGLQTATSYVQLASAYLDQVHGILSRMAELAQTASPSAGGSPAAAGSEFTGLQQDLRGIIGGSAQEIGGSSDASQAGAAFGGSDLFGPSAGVTVSTGLATAPSLTVGSSNLRQGALRILISQDSAGAFAIGPSDPGAGVTVSEAAAEAAAAAGALGSSQAAVDAVAFATQDAPAGAVASPADAAATLQNALRSLGSQPGAALAAQAPSMTPSILGLLQVA
jgi:hypothetical protein